MFDVDKFVIKCHNAIMCLYRLMFVIVKAVASIGIGIWILVFY